MSGTSGVFDAVKSPDEIFKLLYTTCYRLTGNHRLTAKLIEASVCTLNPQGRQGCNKLFKGIVQLFNRNKNINVNSVFKALCSAFINKTTLVCEQDHTYASMTTYEYSRSGLQMQEALLCLPPLERLLVVLRDTLGLTYSEIADLTELDKTDVACLLSAGRWSLRKVLNVSSPSKNPPKRARAMEFR